MFRYNISKKYFFILGIVVKAYYNFMEDPNSILGRDTSWEGKSDYAQK